MSELVTLLERQAYKSWMRFDISQCVSDTLKTQIKTELYAMWL